VYIYVYVYLCICIYEYIHIHLCIYEQENSPPLPSHVHHNNKRCLPLSSEEKREICKRIKTHHMDNKGVFNLEADNGLPVTFVHVPTPRKGTADVCKRTVQQRSHIIETVQQLVSTPSTSTSCSTSNHHLHAQLTSVIKRNKDTYTTCAEAAGINILHRFSVDKMLELHKLISAPYSLIRNIRSFLHSEGMYTTYMHVNMCSCCIHVCVCV
jgi:DNA primase catalytic subunit